MPDALTPFDHAPRTRLVFGPGAIDRLGELARELGGRRVLLVSDPGVAATGHLDLARDRLHKAGLTTVVYDAVRANPTTADVDRCRAVADDADLVIAVGGGSALDTAKGANFLLTNGGQMRDYQGKGRARTSLLPMIAVPTTAGTGSETQSFALIADEQTHQKMACGDPSAAPRIALLDPRLTLTMPPQVTAVTGLDAIAHAVESAVCKAANPVSIMYSREALRLTWDSLPMVLADPHDLAARGRMLLGAALAGLAIENAMLGVAHACANPLTAHHGLVHGHAVAIMLPHAIRFNATSVAAGDGFGPLPATADVLAAGITQRLALAGLPHRLRDLGIATDNLAQLAPEAAAQWTAGFNPRPVTAEDCLTLYRAAW